jgi:hypothetical protein
LVAFGAETFDGLDEQNFGVCHDSLCIKSGWGVPVIGVERGIFRSK